MGSLSSNPRTCWIRQVRSVTKVVGHQIRNIREFVDSSYIAKGEETRSERRNSRHT